MILVMLYVERFAFNLMTRLTWRRVKETRVDEILFFVDGAGVAEGQGHIKCWST